MDPNPFQSPTESAEPTGHDRTRRIHFVWMLLGSMIFGAIAVLADYFTSHQYYILELALLVIWLASAAVVMWQRHLIDANAAIIAVTWGYLISFISVITLLTGRLPFDDWPRNIGAFIALPLFIMATVLPFWLLAKWLRSVVS